MQSADEADKAHTIDPPEARAFDRPVADDAVLAQQQVFHDQVRFTARDVNHDAARRPVLIGWSSASNDDPPFPRPPLKRAIAYTLIAVDWEVARTSSGVTSRPSLFDR